MVLPLGRQEVESADCQIWLEIWTVGTGETLLVSECRVLKELKLFSTEFLYIKY